MGVLQPGVALDFETVRYIFISFFVLVNKHFGSIITCLGFDFHWKKSTCTIFLQQKERYEVPFKVKATRSFAPQRAFCRSRGGRRLGGAGSFTSSSLAKGRRVINTVYVQRKMWDIFICRKHAQLVIISFLSLIIYTAGLF